MALRPRAFSCRFCSTKNWLGRQQPLNLRPPVDVEPVSLNTPRWLPRSQDRPFSDRSEGLMQALVYDRLTNDCQKNARDQYQIYTHRGWCNG
jgi:hypothetical protein